MAIKTSMLHVRVDDKLNGAWFRAKVQEALTDKRPPASHRQVMHDAQALIDRKRGARN